MKYFYIVSILLAVNYQVNAQSNYTFEISKGAHSFQLNKQQGFNALFSHVDEKNNEFLRSVDSPTSAIEVFNLKTGAFKYNIKLKGVGISNFKKNVDGTYWVYYSWQTKFLLIDKTGKILKELKDIPRNNIDLLSVDGKFRPIVEYKNAIYSTGLYLFRKDLNVKASFYLNSGVLRKTNFGNKVSYIGKLSAKAKNNFYGNMNSYSITQNGNNIILAPVFSEELQIIDLDKETTSFVSVNSKYANLITSMSSIKDHSNFTNSENNQFVEDSYSLIGIVYDKYREVYYRFVRLPSTQNTNNIYAMYVMDKNFRILFYYNFPNGYLLPNYFITSKGLHIMDKKSYQKDGGNIAYDLFKLIKK